MEGLSSTLPAQQAPRASEMQGERVCQKMFDQHSRKLHNQQVPGRCRITP
jgi:hypothetical protein